MVLLGSGWIQFNIISSNQKLRPTSDISAGSWTPSTGATLYGVIDETTANDTDYISTTTSSTCEVRFEAGGDPVSSVGHIIRFRAKALTSLTAYLYQNTTLISTFVATGISNTVYQDFTWTLSESEANSITDYTNLRVRFTGV